MTDHTPQIQAATALLELVSTPDIPTVTWGIGPDGVLSGYSHEQPITTLDTYRDILGGTVHNGTEYTAPNGTLKVAFTLFGVWREVHFSLVVIVPSCAVAHA